MEEYGGPYFEIVVNGFTILCVAPGYSVTIGFNSPIADLIGELDIEKLINVRHIQSIRRSECKDKGMRNKQQVKTDDNKNTRPPGR